MPSNWLKVGSSSLSRVENVYVVAGAVAAVRSDRVPEADGPGAEADATVAPPAMIEVARTAPVSDRQARRRWRAGAEGRRGGTDMGLSPCEAGDRFSGRGAGGTLMAWCDPHTPTHQARGPHI